MLEESRYHGLNHKGFGGDVNPLPCHRKLIRDPAKIDMPIKAQGVVDVGGETMCFFRVIFPFPWCYTLRTSEQERRWKGHQKRQYEYILKYGK